MKFLYMPIISLTKYLETLEQLHQISGEGLQYAT